MSAKSAAVDSSTSQSVRPPTSASIDARSVRTELLTLVALPVRRACRICHHAAVEDATRWPVQDGGYSSAMPVRLTQFARGGGCACKIPPGELEDVVARLLPQPKPADLLIGAEHGDDAAVVQISPTRALVATVDFFTPV